MSTTVEGKLVRVVHGTQDPSSTSQTRGHDQKSPVSTPTPLAPARSG